MFRPSSAIIRLTERWCYLRYIRSLYQLDPMVYIGLMFFLKIIYY